MIFSVKAGEQSYPIYVESGALGRAGDLFDLDRKVLLVTDDGVPPEYAATVAGQCGEPHLMTIKQGEASKRFENFQLLLSAMLRAGFTRGDCVAAVGGGVVGDLAGFAAACYMRGIPFYNIPTTLLSQVDSSIGGKTAIDLDGVKNIVGAFYPPAGVLVDPESLRTLDRRQLHAGLTEAIKMAVTSDPALFELIEESADLPADLPEIIRRSLLIKKDVVEQDPKETGLRRVLNFGHTLGHAVESVCAGGLLHGEAVALGMLPMCGDGIRERVKDILKKYELPTEWIWSRAELEPFLSHDKKRQGDRFKAVFSDAIGSFRIETVSAEELFRRLEGQR